MGRGADEERRSGLPRVVKPREKKMQKMLISRYIKTDLKSLTDYEAINIFRIHASYLPQPLPVTSYPFKLYFPCKKLNKIIYSSKKQNYVCRHAQIIYRQNSRNKKDSR